MWLNTWITILAVMGWIVVGLAITFPDVPWLITVGAVAIAVGVPVLCLPAVKLLQTGVLLRWDPPPDRMQP